ncbi:hypothetical protein [Microvirga sp. M2]|uniref:hypothetical protein n=1 Tax=Microvirga sp. M2 TaxID=3073270 RepID=UPI0039C1A036
MASNPPLIQLEPGGTAPVLRYDIPEPTSYEGKNFIALSFEDDIFLPVASEMPSSTAFRELQQLPENVLRAELETYLRTGVSERAAVRGMRVPSARLARGPSAADLGTTGISPPRPSPTEPLPPPPVEPDKGQINDLIADILGGKRYVKGVRVDGTPTVDPVPVPNTPDPHLYLVESIKLTSFLGDYGAGRIVKTFSLLPGEKTKISIRTFLQRETTRKSASSVLDSLTEESAADLETSVTSEQSDQSKYESTKEYYAEGEASAKWGWGSAKVKAGAKGSSNAAREELVKNIANATEKHTARASAKRDVEVNTSYEETVKSEEELATERQIENINLSRTLNFVFRQMNQKFITMLHLTDVRIAFFNGDRSSRREVPISRLDDLLEEVVRDDKRAMVRTSILEQLSAVRAYDGSLVNVVSEVQLSPSDAFHQFDPKLNASISDDRGRIFSVPGVLLQHGELVMRTEGVIVEALLGNGDALDGYAIEMQLLEAGRRRAEVQSLEAKAAQIRLVNQAIAEGDDAAVERAERLTGRRRKEDAEGPREPDDHG